MADTSTVLDLHFGRLLQQVGKLGIALLAPAHLISKEYRSPPGDELVASGLLRAEEMTPEELRNAARLHIAQGGRLSFGDSSAVALAAARELPLLTSEKRLRAVAEGEGITVRGTLWLMDNMVERNIIAPLQAAEALERMLAAGRRLPPDECQKRLQRWSSA